AGAGLLYEDGAIAEVAGHVRLDWGAMSAWFEEDEQVFTHPRSPYTRIDILPTSREVVVRLGDLELARSTRGHALFETGLPPRWYLPRTDVRMDLLVPSDTVSHCPYKGRAEHFSARVGDEVVPDVAWSYPAPLPESVRIAGLVAFYDGRVDGTVGGTGWARTSRGRTRPRCPRACASRGWSPSTLAGAMSPSAAGGWAAPPARPGPGRGGAGAGEGGPARGRAGLRS